MNGTLREFYETLFDEGDFTCFTDTPFGIELKKVVMSDNVHHNTQYFSINPLMYSRRDDDVCTLRNILVELDKGTIDEQHKILEESELPFSTLVFSGKKSLHAIISLETPLESIEEYKALAKRIYNKLGGKSIVDVSVGNPSRLSRTPGAFRAGTKQALLGCAGRVHNDVLFKWLGPEEVIEKPIMINQKEHRLISSWTSSFLRMGAEKGEWNNKLFMAACDMVRAGYTREEIIEKCLAIEGTLCKRSRATIDSACRRASNDSGV